MEEFRDQFEQVKTEVDRGDHILLIAHQKPDGDCLGATLALSHYLAKQAKGHLCFCVDPVPDQFSYLPRSEHMINDHEHVLKFPIDRIVVLDSGDLAYAGVEALVEKLRQGNPVVINIDHHPTNDRFGDVNLVHPAASSTSEILFHFFDHHRVPIDRDMATCLLTGILTDTGSFSNLATTPSSLEVAGKLLAKGARLKHITQFTLRNMSLPSLKLWGRVLSRLREDPKTRIVTTVIRQKDFEELGLSERDATGIANFLNNLQDAKMVVVYKEEPGGKVKASMRTTERDVDVAAIAKAHGGGGHKKAAGFTVSGTLAESEQGWQVMEADGKPVSLAA